MRAAPYDIYKSGQYLACRIGFRGVRLLRTARGGRAGARRARRTVNVYAGRACARRAGARDERVCAGERVRGERVRGTSGCAASGCAASGCAASEAHGERVRGTNVYARRAGARQACARRAGAIFDDAQVCRQSTLHSIETTIPAANPLQTGAAAQNLLPNT